ncbi:hypothetical protein CVT26_007390 [Gymnopilus dilepis]|uniref:Uncharacterized protein n=1 Tax=Gymnopilus dilepis TaxID=231916 RepID=A0A409X128_9AGAR|nr:hypothetical protein CVT26_007390 [Gymnopilus dilepis]
MSHPLTPKAPLELTQASTISLQDLSPAQESAPQSIDHHPPISILPPDILYRIFDFCTFMHPHSDYNTPALSRLQDLSRVCTHWSTLLLAAPSLWSRALNLTYMRRFLLPPCRAETIRRAGQAPMTVQVGKVLAADAPFVFEFLERYWHQIEGLHILNRYGNPNVRPRDAQRWCELAARASDRLRHLSVRASPRMTASFLTSVALNRFPCLESLDIFRKEQGIRDKDCVETEDIGSNCKFAALPRLRRIAFSSEYMLPRDLDGILEFLHGITPAAGCRLAFKSRFPFQYAPPSTVGRLLSVFERYYGVGGTPGTSVRVCSSSSTGAFPEPTAFVFLKRELRIFVPTELGSRSTPVAFHLRGSDSDTSIPPMHQPEPNLVHQILIPAMISHLQTYPLGTIEVLRLGIEHPRFFAAPIYSALDALVLKLTSVRELRTDGTTLRHLAALQSQLSESQLASTPTPTLRVVFPALRVLHLDPSGVPDSLPSLRRLVVARRDMGVSVDSLTLSLSMYVEDMDMKVDLVRSELEGLTGLTVGICKYSLYGHYACGTMEVVLP